MLSKKFISVRRNKKRSEIKQFDVEKWWNRKGIVEEYDTKDVDRIFTTEESDQLVAYIKREMDYYSPPDK